MDLHGLSSLTSCDCCQARKPDLRQPRPSGSPAIQLGLAPADALRQPAGAEVLHGRADAQLPRHRPFGGADHVAVPVVAEELALLRRRAVRS